MPKRKSVDLDKTWLTCMCCACQVYVWWWPFFSLEYATAVYARMISMLSHCYGIIIHSILISLWRISVHLRDKTCQWPNRVCVRGGVNRNILHHFSIIHSLFHLDPYTFRWPMPDTSTTEISTSHASQDAQSNHSSTCNSVSRIVTPPEENQQLPLDKEDSIDLTFQLKHLTLHDQSPFMPYIM